MTKFFENSIESEQGAIEEVGADSTIRELGSDESDTLIKLQREHFAVEKTFESYTRKRALLFRNQHRFVSEVSQTALEHHARTILKMGSKSRTLEYGLCAQAVTGVDIYKETNADKRKALHNSVAPTAKMIEALEHYRAEIEGLTDDRFVAWFIKNGAAEGIWRAYKAETSEAATAAEPQAVENITEQLDRLLANPTAIEVDVPGLVAGEVSIFVAQGQGKNARLVRLAATPAFIASLGDRAPDPLTNAPIDLRFWREAMVIGESIIPDTDSDTPKNVLAADDEVNATTEMLPSNAVFLLGGDKISVASARNLDTLVVEILPREEVQKRLGVSFDRERFINNRSRRVTSKRLIAPKVCAGFIPAKPDDGATEITSKGDKSTIKFVHREKAKNSNLVLTPITEMGSVWTYRVAGFKPTSQGVLDAEQTGKLKAGFMPLLQKSKRDLPVLVAFADGAVSFGNGKANPVAYEAAVAGSGEARINASDFKQAILPLLDAELRGGLTWKLDGRGLLMIEGTTSVATYRVYLQTLRDDADVRHRALLGRVEKAAAPVEQAIAA